MHQGSPGCEKEDDSEGEEEDEDEDDYPVRQPTKSRNNGVGGFYAY